MRPKLFILGLLLAFIAVVGEAQTNSLPTASIANPELKHFDEQIAALQAKIQKVKADSHKQPELLKQIPALYAEMTELKKSRRMAEVEIHRGLAHSKKVDDGGYHAPPPRTRAVQ